ncbi:MAG: DMT family transporter [Prochloraceae cyanobacterium]|nr:DMT family transporter [Prochloraceae cyanobacterium]
MSYRSQSIIRGALFIIAAELSFAISAAAIKLLSINLPNESIVFFRNFFGLLALIPLLIRADLNILQTSQLHLHLLRSLSGVAAMYCFFYAIAHISLGNLMLIKSTIPIIIPIVAFAWLGEQILNLTRLAIAIGFIGVFLILKPDADIDWAILVAIASSIMAAIAFVTVRKLSATEPTLRIVLYFASIGLCVSAIPLIWTWQTPSLFQWLMLIVVGIATTLGQLLLTRGYASAPASNVGIFTYTSVPFGALLGWFFWNELWDETSLIGAALIVLAGSISLRTKKSASN